MTEKTERPTLELVLEPSGSVEGDFPRTFGNYLLLHPLGQGGMGDVYLAKLGGIAGIEKHCVLKTLRPQFTDDREYVSRFIDEARVVVQLSHKNICSVFDVGNVEGRYYLAMEYIAGNDLKSLCAAAARLGEALSLGIVLHVVGEVLEALDYAHRHVDPSTGEPLRLVHRDVSPQNVMVSYEGEVKLIDFGLAASTLKLERTEPNVVMGKVAYMSPEQVRGDVVDGRTDIFAAGVMLYELLVGERYYEGKSPYEIWAVAGLGTFKPRKWNDVDAQLREILMKALAPLNDRFKTCAEMREAIEAVRVAHGIRTGTAALRDLVERSMADEISDSRLRLARFKNVKLLRTTASGSLPSTKSAPHTESTETVRKEFDAVVAPQSKKAAMFIAAGLGGALLAVLAVFALRVASPDPPVLASTPDKHVDVAATTPDPAKAATGDAAKAAMGDGAKATTGAAASGDVAKGDGAKGDGAKGDGAKGDGAKATGDGANGDGAKATTGDAAKATTDAAKVAKGTKSAGDGAKVATKSAGDARASAKATDAKKGDGPKSASKTVGPVEEATAFTKKCPSAPCAKTLAPMIPDFAAGAKDKSTDWLRIWRASLVECRAKCK